MTTAQVRPISSYSRMFDVDVFVSYGHIDNQEGWVTNFHSRLQTRLEELLGSSDVTIWRDKRLGGVEAFEEVLKAKVSSSAVFISVLSPRYVASPACRKELDQFVAASKMTDVLPMETQSRLIRVVKTRLIEGTEPANFKTTLGYEFYETDRQNPDDFFEFEAEPGRARYNNFRDRCDMLSQAVARMLLKIRQQAPSNENKENSRTIFLARTTKDLAAFRSSIVSELTGRGHIVLSADNLPDSGPEMRAAVDELIGKANIAVHLVGRSYGVVPEDESRSIGELQYDLAFLQRERTDFHQLVWIPEDLQQVDERQKGFIEAITERVDKKATGETDVYETCFESFKEGLLDVLERKPEKQMLAPGGRVKSVYLVCNQSDLNRDELISIQAYLRGRGYPVELPPFQGEPDELREAEEELIEDTDAALIYYGNAKDVWVLRKRKNLLKVLSKKQSGRAYARGLYLCSPKDDVKANHYLSAPEHRYLEGDGFCPLLVLGDCGEFSTEKLGAFVEAMERDVAC